MLARRLRKTGSGQPLLIAFARRNGTIYQTGLEQGSLKGDRALNQHGLEAPPRKHGKRCREIGNPATATDADDFNRGRRFDRSVGFCNNDSAISGKPANQIHVPAEPFTISQHDTQRCSRMQPR